MYFYALVKWRKSAGHVLCKIVSYRVLVLVRYNNNNNNNNKKKKKKKKKKNNNNNNNNNNNDDDDDDDDDDISNFVKMSFGE